MIVPLEYILPVTYLWGNIMVLLINNSSLNQTFSPDTVTPSILTHLPTVEFHPSIVSEIQLYSPITVFYSTTEFYSLAPTYD